MYSKKYSELKPKIKKIVDLTRKYREEDRTVKKETDYDDFNIEEIVNYKRNISKTMESYIELKDYILSLNMEEVMLLKTVMYIGREECGWNNRDINEKDIDIVFEKHFSRQGFSFDQEIDKEREMYLMLAKTPFHQYLENALNKIAV